MLRIRLQKSEWAKAWRAMIEVAPVRLVADDPIYEVEPAHLELLTASGFTYEVVQARPPKTWSDPIVDDVRRVREAYAARFNYDLRAIFDDLKEQEKRSGREFVSPPGENSVVGLPPGESSAGEHGSPPQPAKTPRE